MSRSPAPPVAPPPAVRLRPPPPPPNERRRRVAAAGRLCTAATLATAVALLAGSPAAAAPAPPSSMSALGDSISRGFNACGWYSDCADRSWSTGNAAGLNSHYQRIRAKHAGIGGRNYNDSRSGARVDGLASQARAAARRGACYVTILIGANDACTSTEAAMTPVATFRTRLDAGLGALRSGVPDAKVFVVSIPNLQRLWEVGRNNGSARSAWSTFNICQSMLARPTSTAPADASRRDRVRQRVEAYNAQLADACADYGPNCRFDGNAAFNYPFALSQVSTWDYFHPNTAGQRILADIT
jgi:lysophospholipase L1-like esterase